MYWVVTVPPGESARCAAEFMRIADAFASGVEPRSGRVKMASGNIMFVGLGGGWPLHLQKKLVGMVYRKG